MFTNIEVVQMFQTFGVHRVILHQMSRSLFGGEHHTICVDIGIEHPLLKALRIT